MAWSGFDHHEKSFNFKSLWFYNDLKKWLWIYQGFLLFIQEFATKFF